MRKREKGKEKDRKKQGIEWRNTKVKEKKGKGR